jgi:hypothetical protein
MLREDFFCPETDEKVTFIHASAPSKLTLTLAAFVPGSLLLCSPFPTFSKTPNIKKMLKFE